MDDLAKHSLAPPEHPLHDGAITLRMPVPADLDAVIGYAERPGELGDH